MSLELYCPRQQPLATCGYLNFKIHFLSCTSHILSAAILDNADGEHFHHHKIFYWTALLQNPFHFFSPTREVRVYMLSHFSYVRLFVTLWTVARQAPLSIGFSRQECWSGLSFPSPGDLPDSGIKAASLMSPALAGRPFTTNATWEVRSRKE